jgi:hypothetical protein
MSYFIAFEKDFVDGDLVLWGVGTTEQNACGDASHWWRALHNTEVGPSIIPFDGQFEKGQMYYVGATKRLFDEALDAGGTVKFEVHSPIKNVWCADFPAVEIDRQAITIEAGTKITTYGDDGDGRGEWMKEIVLSHDLVVDMIDEKASGALAGKTYLRDLGL